MRSPAIVVLGLTGLIGCASDKPEPDVDYNLPTGVAVGDDIVVAMTRLTSRTQEDIVTVRVQAGEPTAPAPALAELYPDKIVGEPALAAIDGKAYLSFYADGGFHGAPLGDDDAIDPGAVVDLGFEPTLVRVGGRFAAVSYPDHSFAVLLPSDTYRASFVTADGRRDGDVDVATLATPIGGLGVPPRCAGNAKLLALVYQTTSFFSLDQVVVARVDATGARVDSGIALAADSDPQTAAGDAQIAVTDDGAALAVYTFVDHGQRSVHATRLEPGAGGAASDQRTDLASVPALLVTSGDRILAVTPPPSPTGFPSFEQFDIRILDDHGRTVAGPTTVTTGFSEATAFATPGGFAVLSSNGADVVMTPIGRDGTPGGTVMVAQSHHAVPEVDNGGCSTGRCPGPALLLLVLMVGWRARSGRRTPRRM